MSRRLQISVGYALACSLAFATVVVRAQDSDGGAALPSMPDPGAPIDPTAPVAPIDPTAPNAPIPPLPPPFVVDADAGSPSDNPPNLFPPPLQSTDAGVLRDDSGEPIAPPSTTIGDGGAPAGDAAARPAQPEIPLLPTNRAPRVEATINPRSVKTGAMTKLVIRVHARRNEEVTVPPGLRFEGPLEVRARRSSSQPQGEGVTHTFELDLQPMAPGVMNLQPIDLRVVLEDGTIGRVQTGALSIDVVSVLGNEPNAQQKPDFPPRSSPQPSWLPGWVLGSLMVLASVVMLTLLGARYLGGREKPAPPPPPPRPAWDVALEKLAKIRASAMLSEGRVKEYVDSTTDALREYLGGRFGFDGLESTSDEIVARLKGRFGSSSNAGTLLQQIRVLLSDGDLVKFAKVEPTPEHCSSMLDEAVRLVRTTTPVTSGGMPGALTHGSAQASPPAPLVESQTSPPSPLVESQTSPPAPLPVGRGETGVDGERVDAQASPAAAVSPADALLEPRTSAPVTLVESQTSAPVTLVESQTSPPSPLVESQTSPPSPLPVGRGETRVEDGAMGGGETPAATTLINAPLTPPTSEGTPARPASFSTVASSVVAPQAPPPVALDDDAAAVGPDDRRSGDDS